MSLEATVLILSIIANVVLGVVTFLSNKKSITNQLFFAFSFSLVFYLFINYMALHQTSDAATIVWIRLVMLIALIINQLFFLLVSAFPSEQLKMRPLFIVLTIAFTVVLLPVTLTNLIFQGVVPGTTQPLPGLGMPLFMAHTFLFVGGGVFNLIRKYRKSRGQEKRQFRLLIIGTALMFIAIITTNMLFVILLKTTSLVGLLPVYTTFFAGVIAYAIVRHGLFDIRVIATQALTMVIWLILFVEIFGSQSVGETILDALVFIATVIFGILLVRSVVREVQQREKLEELTQKLKDMDKQKDEFISMAAHELRSPMTAIKGYVSMIIEGDAGDITEKARGYLSDAKSVVERAIRLVNNMLNVSRIEEGKLVYQLEEVALIKVTQEIYHSFRFEAERKNLEFKLNIPDGVKDVVYVDPDKVREILGNLVSNAIKFTEKGKVEINISNAKKDFIRVEIVDTGPGITEKEQEKLFRKFYRAESTKGKTMGTGLGLYISRLLIEKFSGEIGLDSEFGKGSTFWFEIPIYKGENHGIS